ncbi:EthD domain-containing protein [Xylaria palmicola]|nr:EthD domain-containing protein [Xylaria palmicola]
MPYTMLVFLSRKPGTTPEQFRDYYANSHMPMFRELVGPAHFPQLHVQHYIQRTASAGDGENDGGNTPRNPTTPAAVMRGAQADFDFDVVVTLTYADEAAFRANLAISQRPEVEAKIIADEERFLDRSQTRAVILGEVIQMTAE